MSLVHRINIELSDTSMGIGFFFSSYRPIGLHKYKSIKGVKVFECNVTSCGIFSTKKKKLFINIYW